MPALWHRFVAWLAAFGRRDRLPAETIDIPKDVEERERIEAQITDWELQLYDLMQVNMGRSAKRLNE